MNTNVSWMDKNYARFQLRISGGTVVSSESVYYSSIENKNYTLQFPLNGKVTNYFYIYSYSTNSYNSGTVGGINSYVTKIWLE